MNGPPIRNAFFEGDGEQGRAAPRLNKPWIDFLQQIADSLKEPFIIDGGDSTE